MKVERDESELKRVEDENGEIVDEGYLWVYFLCGIALNVLSTEPPS